MQITNLARARRKLGRQRFIRPVVERWHRSQLNPVSRFWGIERGTPIDRVYLEEFLSKNQSDITGRVLEIGDDHYARTFGSTNSVVDILDVVPRPKVTVVADLADARHVESDQYQCQLILQTLMLIYDVKAAVDTIYRIAKPGGIVLASTNFIAPNCDDECQELWHWGFTPKALHRVFADRFGPENVSVEAYGNYYAASAYLMGLSGADINQRRLWPHETGYEILTGVRAVKQ